MRRWSRWQAAAAIVLAVPVHAVPAVPGAVHRCVNLANALEAPFEGKWGRAITDDDVATVAGAGFDTVRLPVAWSAHAAAAAPYTVDPTFMARVAHVVDTAVAAHLRIIVDDHNDDPLFTDPDGQRDRLAGIWRQVGARFAQAPRDRVWFEIENEPHGRLTNANLMATLGPALAAIRATNPDRPVVIGGEGWSGVGSLATLALPADPNIVPTFHYYEPFAFTHQGAGWVTPVQPLGRDYGGPADAARLAGDVVKVRAFIARDGRVPLMGEYGAYETAALGERVAYYTAISHAFDAAGVGGCAWAYVNTFPLHETAGGDWLPGMLAALGLGSRRSLR